MLKLEWDEEYGCYDVRLINPEASVADLEEACRKVFSQENARRRYAAACLGCALCCSDRIPVTRLDLERLYRGVQTELPWDTWLRRTIAVTGDGQGIDINLMLGDNGICRFWDPVRGGCSVYRYRPLVCATYICAPLSHRLEELRSQIINLGLDELGDALEKKPQRESNPFAGAHSYGEISLKRVCSPRLWRWLNL